MCPATKVGTLLSGTKHNPVVGIAVSSTTSITGARCNWRGSSLTNACSSAGRHKAEIAVFGCSGALATTVLLIGIFIIRSSEAQAQVFGNRPQGQGRQTSQAAHQKNGHGQQGDEQRARSEEQ